MGTRISSIIGRSGWSFENLRDAISVLGMHLEVDWMKSAEELLNMEVSGNEGYCLERIIDYLLRNGQFYLQQIHAFSAAGGDWVRQLYSMENQNAPYSRDMTVLRRNVIKIISQLGTSYFKGLGLFYFYLDRMIDLLASRSSVHTDPLQEENAYAFVSSEEKEIAGQIQNFLRQIPIQNFLVGEREEAILCLCQHLHSLQNFAVASQYLVSVMEAGVNDPLIYYNYFVIASTLQDWDVAFQGYKIASDALPALSFAPPEYSIEQIVEKNRFYISFYGQYKEKNVPILIKTFFQPPESVRKAIAHASELNHQGIITLFDWYEISPSRACLIMEYIAGPSLDVFVEQEGTLDGKEWLQVSLQILGAMAYAHDHDVAHGALNPSKILFDNTNLKIADFGIYPLEAWPLPITRQNLLYNSFIAPEILKYGTLPDKVSDVYSLGMILYYLLTGSHFGIKQNSNIPPVIMSILEKATSLDPKERYANATEFMMDIAHWEENAAMEENEEQEVSLVPKTIIPAVPKERVYKPGASDIVLPENMVWQNDIVYNSIDESQMVVIPAGFFSMGSPERPTESPVHEVYLDTYLIDKYPVTNAQYARFLEYIQKTQDHSKCHADEAPGKDHTPKDWQTPKYAKYSEHENCPVIFIDWWDAWAYASWAGKTLPSEAQWEKAARSSDNRKYPWGNDEPNKSLANYNDEFGCTTKVNSFPQGSSPYGCLDMAGNVWEWCIDTYDKDFYKESPTENPACIVNKPARSSRGGSWNDSHSSLRTTARGCWINMVRYGYIGFRCVKLL